MARIKRQVVLDDDQRGMQLGLDPFDEWPEGFGLALGHARGGFVQADDRRGGGQKSGQLDDAAGAGGQLGDEAVGVAAQTEEVDQLGGLGAALPLQLRADLGDVESVPQNDVVSPRFERQLAPLRARRARGTTWPPESCVPAPVGPADGA